MRMNIDGLLGTGFKYETVARREGFEPSTLRSEV